MMKWVFSLFTLCMLLFLASAESTRGQERGGPPAGGPPPAPPPLLVALDENADGEISAAEIEVAGESLKGLDRNGDGKLGSDEIRPRGPAPREGGPDTGGPEGQGSGRPQGTAGLGPRGREPGQFMARLKQADQDGDGKISKNEAPERLKMAFDRLDGNGDGFIDEHEMQSMPERGGGLRNGGGPPDGPPGPPGPGGGFGPPEALIDRLFQFDEDGDGKLTREELTKMAENFGAMGRRGGGDQPEPPDGQGENRPRRPQRPNGGNNN